MSSDDTERLALPPGGGTEHHSRESGAEIEIKFCADEAAQEAVRSALQLRGIALSAERELISVYFDTASGDLQLQGLLLRIRRDGGSTPILAAKWASEDASAPFARGEAETPCPGGEADIDLFDPVLRGRLSQAIGKRALAPVFKSHVRRRTAVVHHGRSEIELAFDNGYVLAGERSLALSEVELELKSGRTIDLIDFAREMSQDCGLSLQFEAKSSRGHRLATSAAAAPQKAKQLNLRAADSVDDVMAAVLAGCLSHFTSNWAALRESDAPEAVHQLRVALRRLRSALGIFLKQLGLHDLEETRQRARRIASALGAARDCDVFRQNALAGPFHEQPQRLTAAEQLLDAVEARRRDGYSEARRIIDDPSTSQFVLDVSVLVTQRAWRTALAPGDLGLLTSPANEFAAVVLDRLRRRAVKRGRHLSRMTDEERHELRIALKGLRYAAEFFGSLFAHENERRKLLGIVAALQDELGAHNDAATAEAFIASLDLDPGAQAHFAAGYIIGFYRHASLAAEAQLAKTWKAFRRADPFWA